MKAADREAVDQIKAIRARIRAEIWREVEEAFRGQFERARKAMGILPDEEPDEVLVEVPPVAIAAPAPPAPKPVRLGKPARRIDEEDGEQLDDRTGGNRHRFFPPEKLEQPTEADGRPDEPPPAASLEELNDKLEREIASMPRSSPPACGRSWRRPSTSLAALGKGYFHTMVLKRLKSTAYPVARAVVDGHRDGLSREDLIPCRDCGLRGHVAGADVCEAETHEEALLRAAAERRAV